MRKWNTAVDANGKAIRPFGPVPEAVFHYLNDKLTHCRVMLKLPAVNEMC